MSVTRAKFLVGTRAVVAPGVSLFRMMPGFDRVARVEDGRLLIEQTEAAA